jgi:hypothetical protein
MYYIYYACRLTSLEIHFIYLGKGKVCPVTGHEGPEGKRGIALLFL